jgi:hypothetical protein
VKGVLAGEEKNVGEVNIDMVFVEGDSAVMVPEEAYGQKGTGGEMWEDMALSGSSGRVVLGVVGAQCGSR